MAAFMACAHAKFTGEVGVCLATSGPGAIHLLNGLYDAKIDHQPVVAIVGQQARAALGGDYQQEVDLVSLFKDVAHEYVQMALGARRRSATSSTARCASRIAERTVTCIIVPNDVQELRRRRRRRASTARSTPGIGYSRAAGGAPRRGPAARRRRAQRGRARGDAGRRRARSARRAEVTQVAELLGAGVAKALLGKAVLPDDLPFVTGSIGLLGTQAELGPDGRLRHAADGRLELPLLGVPARGGPGARRADRHRRADALASATRWRSTSSATARETLRALLPLLERKADRRWREQIEERRRASGGRCSRRGR